MLFRTTGHVSNHFYVAGLSVYPIYLLDGETPVLFDGGVCCGGKMYGDSIRSILGGRKPATLFITHMHWDHCGAVTHLKNLFPSLRVAASRKAAEILKRDNALALISDLNRKVRPIVASLPGVDPSQLIDEPFRPFEPDMELMDGQVIELGGSLTVEVLATPGHTNDLMSYFIPQRKILISSEASGCLDNTGNVITEFLADFDAYLSSLERLSALPAEVLCQGHRIVFVGRDEVRSFLSRSIAAAVVHRDRIYRLLEEEAGDLDRVMARVKAEQYDTNKGIKQPEGPYLLNLRAQVTHLAGKLG